MDNQNYPNDFGIIPGSYFEQFRQTPHNQFPPHGGGTQGNLPIHGDGGQQGSFPFPGGGQHGGFPLPGGGSHGGFPFPGGGGPGGFPGGQHDGFPSHGGDQQAGAPTTPPPSVIPHESVGLMAVEAGGLRGCLHRFTYIWLNNGRSFWFYPTYIGRTSTAGFRWRRNRWEYYGTDLRRIRSFRCY